jgi:hypothetical protein
MLISKRKKKTIVYIICEFIFVLFAAGAIVITFNYLFGDKFVLMDTIKESMIYTLIGYIGWHIADYFAVKEYINEKLK